MKLAQTVHREPGLPGKRVRELVADYDDVQRRHAEFQSEPSNAGQVFPIWEFEQEASHKARKLVEEGVPKEQWIALCSKYCILIEDRDSGRTVLRRVRRRAVELAPPSASAASVQRNARELIENHQHRGPNLLHTRSGLLALGTAIAGITVVLWRYRRVWKAGS